MAGKYEVEVTIESARDLKNVNWKHGDLRPYAVVWIDPAAKASTKVDVDGDCNPTWDEKLVLQLGPSSLEDAVLSIDIVHADASEGVKPLIGSAHLPLKEVIDEAGIGGKCRRSLKLKRPSGRPHGHLEVKVAVKESARYYAPPPASYAPPYAGPASASREYGAPPPSGYPYAAPPSSGYPYGAPQASGYPYGAPPPSNPYGAPPAYGAPPTAGYSYGAPPVQTGYGYGQPPPVYEYDRYGQQPAYVQGEKKSKMGMGTGLAVGAAAGVLGGLALAEGADYVEDKITDEAAEKVEDDLGYDDSGDW